MARLTRPARRVRFVIDCETTEQVLDLLALTKAHKLAPQMGIANGVDHAWPAEPDAAVERSVARQTRRQRKGGKLARETAQRRAKALAEGRSFRPKPKRYKPSIMVQLGDEPAAGTMVPRAIKTYKALKAEFGDQPFKKRDAKGVLVKRLHTDGGSGYVTMLLDAGALKPVSQMAA